VRFDGWHILFGVVIGAFVYYGSHRVAISPNTKDALDVAGSLMGVLAGFMFAAASILASIGDKPFMDIVQRQGVYERLINRMFSGVRWCVATAVLSIIGILYDPSWDLWWYPLAVTAYSAVFATAVAVNWRVLSTFALLMRILAKRG
jgi:hypothetical protein